MDRKDHILHTAECRVSQALCFDQKLAFSKTV